jgi:predicted dehydrogenase
MSIWSMKQGKDVYCQKPLCLTIHEAWAMVEAARRYGRVFQTGSQQRSSREFRVACEYVRSGRIGTVTQVNVNVGGPSSDRMYPTEPVPEGFDWDLWLGPAPWMPYNGERCSGNYGGGWRQVRDYSGGMMTDWGAHHFDICQWGLGMDGSGPAEVVPPQLSETGKLTYTYPKTPVGDNIKVVHAGGGNGVLFIGTKGKMEVNRGYIKSYPETILKESLGSDDVRLYDSPGHYQDFIDCVKSRTRPICDVEVGASSITVCHLGNIAWWLGRKLEWDPVAHRITNDAEAARWQDRPKRAPWHL